MHRAWNHILFLIHEAPYISDSKTLLISEYQVRYNGIVINSCSTNHKISSDPVLYGKRRVEWTAPDGTPNFTPIVNRGGTIGIPIFPYEEGDDKKFPIIELTPATPWIPSRHRRQYTIENESPSSTTTPSVSTSSIPLDFPVGRV